MNNKNNALPPFVVRPTTCNLRSEKVHIVSSRQEHSTWYTCRLNWLYYFEVKRSN